MSDRSSFVRLAAALVAALGVGAACSYDWSTATDGGANDGGQTDVHVDGPSTDGNVVDAPVPDAGARDAADAAPGTDAADCMRLFGSVASARASAKACTGLPADCTTTVTDECGCPQIVGAQNTAWANYKGAVAAFDDAGCTNPACPQPCPTAMQHLCIVADSSTGLACTQ